MTKLGCALVAFLVGCGGSAATTTATATTPVAPPTAPACDVTVHRLIDRMIADDEAKDSAKLTPEQDHQVHEMANSMSIPLVGACTDDHWTAEVRTCFGEAKTEVEGKKCEDMMTPAQRDGVSARINAAMAADKAAAAAPTAVAAITAALPPECDDYRKEVEKFAACDQIPQASRDALTQAFAQAMQSLGTVPADQRAEAATACKAGADAIRQASPCK